MGLSNMDMSGFDAEAAQYNKMNRNNQAEFAPGQGETMDNMLNSNPTESTDSGQMGSIFGDSSDFNAGGVGGFNNSFGGMVNGFDNGGMFGQTPMQPQQQGGSGLEDLIEKGATKGLSGVVDGSKSIFSSFKGLTPLFWQNYGKNVLIVSVVMMVTGLVGNIFGLKIGWSLAISGALGGIIGSAVLMFNTQAAQACTDLYTESNEIIPQDNTLDGGMDSFAEMGDVGSWDTPDEDWDTGEEADYEGYEEEDYSDEWGDIDETPAPVEAKSTEDALREMENGQIMDKGMYTRQFLYQKFTEVLPEINPQYDRVKTYDVDSDVFLFWGEKLIEAAEVSGCKEENYPELLELHENTFTMELVCTRNAGIKPDVIARELANIYADSQNISAELASKAKNVGRNCKITIFTGQSAAVSLRDMYSQAESFVLNAKNYIPIVLGIDTEGKVLMFDFKKLESVIVAGMPRSGKSWYVQCILYQMCAYVSPKELQLYVCDPKGKTSDFKAFVFPHVRKFAEDDASILKLLRYVVKIEGPRRNNIIGNAGHVNIWDFRKENPEVDLPIIYVIVDEIVTLAQRMDPDTKKEFQSLLIELISRLPAVGIRALLIPHRITNDIIAKTATDLVKCKISVCGTPDHIEQTTGTKPKDFPFKLINVGDMAVRMPDVSGETMFIHAPVLTLDNDENRNLFRYGRKVWGMLEPEVSEASPVASEAQISEEQRAMINKIENMDDDDIDLFS